MERIKILTASGIFILLTLIKFLAPDVAADIRAETSKLVGGEDDIAAVISLVENGADKLIGPRTETAEETAADEAVIISYLPVYSRQRAELGTIQGEVQPQIAMPSAAETFLASQEPFASYSLPANVTYDYRKLPFEFALPVEGKSSSGFGYRIHPIHGDVRFHYGTDVAAWSGENIFAFASGTVAFAGTSDSYGNYIVIDHGNGWQSLYAHCSRLLASGGDTVAMGQKIALVGDTGITTGPHLHFELTQNGVYVNPEYYINDLFSG